MSFIISRRKAARGQAFAEFLIALIVLPIFITGIITISRMFIINQRLHHAARHGAFLYATRRVTWANTRNEIMKYFTDSSYPKFDTSKITITNRNRRVGLIAGREVTVSYSIKMFDLSNLAFWKATPKKEKRFSQSVVCGAASF